MNYKVNIWKSPDDSLFRFHVENEFGQTIRHKSSTCETAIRQGVEHFYQTLVADFADAPEMFNGPKE